MMSELKDKKTWEVDVVDKVVELYRCPNCGHSPNNHKSGRNTCDMITKGQTPHLLHKYRNREGKWFQGEYASNSTPGGIVGKLGCFKAIKEVFLEFTPETEFSNAGYNYYKFCDCPIDQETVLALIKQGKTFKET